LTTESVPQGWDSLHDAGAAVDFITMLFAGVEDGWLTVFAEHAETGARTTRWVRITDLSAVAVHVDALAPTHDVWFGVATRSARLGNGRRGGKDDCVQIPALWLDIDTTHAVHSNGNLPKDNKGAGELALSLGLPMSGTVFSGHGIQPYWLLQEPIDAEEAVIFLARWQLTWERLAKEHGYHLDDVSNIDRVMRLVGTVNRKDVPVLVTRRGPWSRRYGLDDLDERLDELPPPKMRKDSGDPWPERDYYNTHNTCDDVLLRYGCTVVRHQANGQVVYARPHHPNPRKAKSFVVYPDNHAGVYTNAIEGVERLTGHDVWGLHVVLNFEGDFAAANEALRTQLGPEWRTWAENERTSNKQQTSASPRLKLVTASSVPIDRPTWVWDRRIPIGGTTLMPGREGLGKTLLVCWLAALLSRGMLPGMSFGTARDVIYVGIEDDRSTVMVPRLKAAGADLDRVHFVDIPKGGTFSLNVDADELTVLAEGVQAALVVVDPLDSHLGPIDSHKKAEVQAAVARLAELAQAVRCGALGLAHFNKSAMRDVLLKVVGSVGFTTAVRSVLGVGESPDDPNERLCVLAKANSTDKTKVAAVRFKPEPVFLDHPDGGYIDTARATILGEVHGIDPNSILVDPEERSATVECVEWLEQQLKNGPKTKRDIEEVSDYSSKVLRLARRKLDVIVYRDEAKKGRPSTWCLPDEKADEKADEQ
jgi:hypothetical protein